MTKNLLATFTDIFSEGETKIRTFFAPGRVNLIGEHTDYNGGHVFPCALSIGTTAIVRKRKDRMIQFYSTNFTQLGVLKVSLDKLVYDQADDWANYPKGVIAILEQHGYKLDSGFDVLYEGEIPNGAGLSSSASIEVVTAIMLNELYSLSIDRISLVKMCQQAENEFIGVSCGIMDQFAIGMGKEKHAILLDCDKLDYTYSPLDLEDASLIIANTNKRRGLADSKYNERRGECERALKDLQEDLDIRSLGELTPVEFDRNAHLIKQDVDRRRAKHAVYENARTIEAVKKLQDGDIAAFGQLMNASHISLRDDYEVTGKELDALVEAAWEQEGVIGSRMTGAGFGGCTISIVNNEYIDAFIETVGGKYEEQTGLKADFYVVQVGDGAKEIIGE
ncbi:galactokinase [Cytobacillus oceanisediminis]|uniref:galactokinase n=1 Tax=Cytobacillus oceanisediminis TaxID=665099 RepID=UPI0003329372|nr:galactokinase [Cytobacillus oceanisediminis]EOR22236.1 galactokinase [Niallia nealsonii AAU1]MBQ6448350.1 galactokinase [Bacillus sp. (in: firmicutes)]MBZ9532966.1 galactokinase [Cytobacillus oceanisediminis]